MTINSVHDRAELAELLSRDLALHAYELGDLDDFFWPYTTWYRHGDSVALLYHGSDPPTLLALDRPEHADRLAALVDGLLPLLPVRCHAHLSPGAESRLADRFAVESHGPHLKMALTDPDRLPPADPAAVVLSAADLPELLPLYAAAYPGNWFDPRMLGTGQYVGVRRDGELLAVAGVHVWSPGYRVAALGNVTSHPRVRGQGLARAAVATLCRRLLGTVQRVALNVRADNERAVALYTGLGFTPVAEYGEFSLTARG
ncbi:GNAT family N-acetyltransferase [Micromonospora sp. NPDC049559]|uniref:GNAT family N-acetyltransferase n=1 Tax=Micromonospora sp. NPDC049559 TaxID=3155923 RepID=UPI0034146A08